MSCFDPSPGLRWLFCMTHPDDEISICAWIRRLTQHGADVWMSWTHDTPAREAEARAVAEVLGVSQERLFFHGAPDGTVCEHMRDLVPRFQAMIELVKPDRIACGAFEQGHLDHDATNWLVNAAARSAPPAAVFEIPFYHTYLTRFPVVGRFAIESPTPKDPIAGNQLGPFPGGVEALELTGQERAFKKEIAKSYPTQRIWLNLMAAQFRARLTGGGSLLDREFLRVQTHLDFRRPNVPAPLATAVERHPLWKRWLRCLDAVEGA